MSGETACVFDTGVAIESQLTTIFAVAAFCAFEDFGTGLEGDCNTEFIRAEQISNIGNWESF